MNLALVRIKRHEHRIVTTLSVALLVLACGRPIHLAASAGASPQSDREFHVAAASYAVQEASPLLIRLRECPVSAVSCTTAEEHMARLKASYGLRAVRQIPGIDVWVVEYSAGIQSSLLDALARDEGLLWVEPNGQMHASEIIPNDTFYQAQQAYLRLIGLPTAWLFTTGDDHPIAVIDSGMDLDHPDLAAKIWINNDEVPSNNVDDDGNGYQDDGNGWDFANNDAVPQDDFSHGSHVAGIAAAYSNNATGIAGVSWESSIMVLKALDEHGDGSWADIAEAIVYAADNGARVLNMSLGGSESSQTIEAAVLYAQGKGCLLVASVGNTSSASVEYPAALPGVLGVAATTADDQPALFGNRGDEVDIAAPGVDILSANNSGGYYVGSGTSASAPHTSGLAALVWSVRPLWTSSQVADAITSTALDVYLPGWDSRTGWGRIDAQAAILQAAAPEVSLTADRSSIVIGYDPAILTATVAYSQGLPAPNGLPVIFSSTLGIVNPISATISGGKVTATLTSAEPGQVAVTASVATRSLGSDSITIISVADEPILKLSSDRKTIGVVGQPARLTAILTYDGGISVPDGYVVTFTTTLGSVIPITATTQAGQAISTFSSSRCGQATISARAGIDAQDEIDIDVCFRAHLPVVLR